MKRDPVASTTIARLYLAQGYPRKAQRVLEDVLTQPGSHGAARHLQSRLQVLRRPTLQATVSAAGFDVRWSIANTRPRRHVVLRTFACTNVTTRSLVTSVPCDLTSGSHTFRAPSAAGWAVVCVGYVHASGFVVEAVSPAWTWPEG